MADIAWNCCDELRHVGCHVGIRIWLQSSLSGPEDHDFPGIHAKTTAFHSVGCHLIQDDPSAIHHLQGRIPEPTHPLESILQYGSIVCTEKSGGVYSVDCCRHQSCQDLSRFEAPHPHTSAGEYLRNRDRSSPSALKSAVRDAGGHWNPAVGVDDLGGCAVV